MGARRGVLVRVDGANAADELRSLRSWLVDDAEFRGRVELRESAATPGTLAGGVPCELGIAGAVAGAGLARVLVAWVRTRVGRVQVRVTRPDGTHVELSAEQVRGLDAGGVLDQVDRLRLLFAAGPGGLDSTTPTPPTPEPAAPGLRAGGRSGGHGQDVAAGAARRVPGPAESTGQG